MQSKVCISHLSRAQQWQHTGSQGSLRQWAWADEGGRGLLDWAAPSVSSRRAEAVAPPLGPQGSAVEWRSLSGGEGVTHSTLRHDALTAVCGWGTELWDALNCTVGEWCGANMSCGRVWTRAGLSFWCIPFFLLGDRPGLLKTGLSSKAYSLS